MWTQIFFVVNGAKPRKKGENMFDRPMSASEIAEELGMTRQNASQLLKRALVKVYENVRRIEPALKPFDSCVLMCQILNVDQTEEELKKFFRLLPHRLKEIILSDGQNRLPESPILIEAKASLDEDDAEDDELQTM